MKFVCRVCGYEEELGNAVDTAKVPRICKRCSSHETFLVDTGGVQISISGFSPEYLRQVAEGIAGNITLKDIIDWIKRNAGKKE